MKECEFKEKLIELLTNEDEGIIFEADGLYYNSLKEDVPVNGRVNKIASELFKWVQLEIEAR